MLMKKFKHDTTRSNKLIKEKLEKLSFIDEIPDTN